MKRKLDKPVIVLPEFVAENMARREREEVGEPLAYVLTMRVDGRFVIENRSPCNDWLEVFEAIVHRLKGIRETCGVMIVLPPGNREMSCEELT